MAKAPWILILIGIVLSLAFFPAVPAGETQDATGGSCANCAQESKDSIMGPKEDVPCVFDADCTVGECCHATTCMNRIAAPDCTRTACTLNCEPGTLDCGGSCACVNTKCTAVFG